VRRVAQVDERHLAPVTRTDRKGGQRRWCKIYIQARRTYLMNGNMMTFNWVIVKWERGSPVKVKTDEAEVIIT
jgi:hypothetical protein